MLYLYGKLFKSFFKNITIRDGSEFIVIVFDEINENWAPTKYNNFTCSNEISFWGKYAVSIKNKIHF